MPRFSHLIACASQVLFVSAGAHAMASSLVLPTPAQLAGHWELKQQGKVCALELLEQANALEGDIACVAQWLGEKPLTWSPTPDGIWLMNAEGSGITHLNRQKEGEYEARTKTGEVVVLQRIP
ncbi:MULTISPECIES: protease inhibitor Inh/omp19 family protein [Pseudomonas]|uniref:Alkaline proteinase inhibitor n=1 Tax=Pseudomonas haemolytica TaxID=2600065 RepID=A0A5P1DF02_9PSED|nr:MULTISPECIES: protease inhibitor Inh/omp19 family protein [Pseudomonas]MBJ2246824.1 protease inhibitor Inh/omp19 family protein [Pseudomonas haemolytica]MBJ2274600.1 protease inhibitor Inh/omp19 family protein [Pseudomonas haemolytica]MBJ2283484.1 protease inhibitor Inh/omp19 family protein [Pseudomonas sp. MF6755]MBK3449562.1 protease inhibitor Inh/omp19 family protein [Pseudomonas haemolytica]MBK3457529.1 protease inhibitor Inh/omp19 family protein [Pseudomonas haemolytica]